MICHTPPFVVLTSAVVDILDVRWLSQCPPAHLHVGLNPGDAVTILSNPQFRANDTLLVFKKMQVGRAYGIKVGIGYSKPGGTP